MYLSHFSDFARTNVETDRKTSTTRRLPLSYQNVSAITGVADFFLVCVSYSICLIYYTYIHDKLIINKQSIITFAIINGFIFHYIAYNHGLYRPQVLSNKLIYVIRILKVWVISCIIVSIAFPSLSDKTEIYSKLIFYSLFIQLILLYAVHIIVEHVLRLMMVEEGGVGRRIVILGEPNELIGLSRTFLARYFGMREVSRISIGATPASCSDEVRINVNKALHDAREHDAEEFVIALRWSSRVLLQSVRDQLRASPLPVRLLPDSNIRSMLGCDALLEGQPSLAVKLQREPITLSERALKRALDIVLATTAILILSPILVCTAAAVKLDSPGPILFRQRRNGFDAKQFVILKFRTMKVLEDGPRITQACRGDHRVTRVGRFLRRCSIDELPQLINVIMGDMSLVGPRPHALAHDHEYKSLIAEYAFRHHVKPGITGWAQVNGLRGETKRVEQMAERVKLDLWYIGHWSFWLDINIIGRTCFEVLRSRAY